MYWPYWVATPKGYFFEGYVSKKAADDSLRENVDRENRISLQNETTVAAWTVKATYAAWFAFGAAMVLVVIEVIKLLRSPESETVVKQVGIFFYGNRLTPLCRPRHIRQGLRVRSMGGVGSRSFLRICVPAPSE